MHLSKSLGLTTWQLLQNWNADPTNQTAALDAFQGDIYRGLIAKTFLKVDRIEAQQQLRILSGLYGILRAEDGIMPYRLEVGYPIKTATFKNLYQFWSDSIAKQLPVDDYLINAASIEYAKLITPFINPDRIIEPQFLSHISPMPEPAFVAVHAKVARGAIARWSIQHQASQPHDLHGFNLLGYSFQPSLSTFNRPVFLTKQVQAMQKD